MLRKLTPAEKFALLIDQYAAAIRDAFANAIAEIKSTVTLSLVIARIEANDVEGTIRALNIEAPVLNPMLDEIAKAYTGGGSSTIGGLPTLRDPEGFRMVLRFDARNPTAEAWLKDHSTTLVRGIVDDQMVAIRQALSKGTAAGLSSRQIAIDIVGRINPATGQRSGGIIGLTSTQVDWVNAFETELRSLDKAALDRNLRDRRFDRSIIKAIEDGKPLSEDAINKMVTAYENRALRYRGETIGRTESLTAFNSASDEAMRQAIASGKVNANMVDQKWATNMDGRERDSHGAMNGQVQPWGNAFTSGSGFALRYPGDPAAPASERINCFPAGTTVIADGITKAYRRWFDGELVEIVTASGHKLSGTPNHPVLTPHGWIGIGLLNEGDDVFRDCNAEGVAARYPNIKDMPSGIEQVFDALANIGPVMGGPLGNMDFHGDAADGNVDIVAAAGKLRSRSEPLGFESIGDLSFSFADEVSGGNAAASTLLDIGITSESAPDGIVGVTDLFTPAVDVHSRPLHGLGFGASTDGYAVPDERFSNSIPEQTNALSDLFFRESGSIEIDDRRRDGGVVASELQGVSIPHRPSRDATALHQTVDRRHGDAQLLADLVERIPLSIEPDRIVKVSKIRFSGHVYNLETMSGTYIANGIHVHNCRCSKTFVIRKEPRPTIQ